MDSSRERFVVLNTSNSVEGHVPADESANAVILPVGGFGYLGRRRALLPAR
jgi:hypothetical protein